MRKLLCILLTFVLCFGLPIATLAAEVTNSDETISINSKHEFAAKMDAYYSQLNTTQILTRYSAEELDQLILQATLANGSEKIQFSMN